MSKAGLIAGAAICAATLWAATGLRAQGAGRTVWDGVYTEAQATRGAASYGQYCGACHGAQLNGTGEAPGLAGGEFISNWNGLSVGEMFDRIRTTMPFDQPGGLSREVYADIIAYMLKFNGFPAGQSELDRRSEVLATIQIIAAKPKAAAGVAPGASASGPAHQSAAAAPQSAAAGAGTADQGGNAPNVQPNPYRTVNDFFKLPPGRTMGSTSAVAVDSKGHIWVVDRCGANSCAESPLDPIMQFDAKGNFMKAFGGGMFLFPHGFYIDHKDHLWLTDGRAKEGKGAQVFEFDPSGKVIRALGKPGVTGDGPDVFGEPNAVVVAGDGTIFVADGHTPAKGNARIMKFRADGTFIKQWGSRGPAQGQIEVPHALAMDSKGRLYVADRWNDRIQIYDQEGQLLGSMTQFGRPSGLYIDKQDILYSADSESRMPEGYGHHPGWKRGIRIGSVSDGVVRAFIPDTDPEPDKSATSGAEGIWADANGVIYGAQVKEKRVARYVKP